jgi:hypothetical protein
VEQQAKERRHVRDHISGIYRAYMCGAKTFKVTAGLFVVPHAASAKLKHCRNLTWLDERDNQTSWFELTASMQVGT